MEHIQYLHQSWGEENILHIFLYIMVQEGMILQELNLQLTIN